jgi:hypothetical protein
MEVKMAGFFSDLQYLFKPLTSENEASRNAVGNSHQRGSTCHILDENQGCGFVGDGLAPSNANFHGLGNSLKNSSLFD